MGKTGHPVFVIRIMAKILEVTYKHEKISSGEKQMITIAGDERNVTVRAVRLVGEEDYELVEWVNPDLQIKLLQYSIGKGTRKYRMSFTPAEIMTLSKL